METQNKTMKNIQYPSIKRSEFLNKSHFKNLNQYSLKNVVKYLTSLKEHKLIDDEEFASLINYTCSLFIESEVEKRLSKVLNDKFAHYLITSMFKE